MAILGEMVLNPSTGEWEQQQTFDPIQNQWAWGDNGLMALGGNPDFTTTLDPFLSVNPEFRGGAPIDAATWQEAVQKSLSGFMRMNYNADPIYNWDPTRSGTTPGSQFQLGTVQDLANTMQGFYNTSNFFRQGLTGEILPGSNLGPSAFEYDSLLGLDPTDKLLAFEDTPLEDVEKMIGSVPAMLWNNRAVAPLQFRYNTQFGELQDLESQYKDIGEQMMSGGPGWEVSGWGTMAKDAELLRSALGSGGSGSNLRAKQDQIAAQIAQKRMDVNALKAQIAQTGWITLAQARQSGLSNDYNDFLFKLDIDKYTPPPEMIKASPESVLRKFFDTPEYRLAYGNDPRSLDPTLDPTERFKFDPGYEFSQEEGFRQLQNRGAARGLLESGPMQRDLQGYAQGLADQNYQRWLTQNVGMFEKWQNDQRQLAMMGPQINGANQANQLGQNLAQLSGQQGSQAAQLLSQLGLTGLQGFSNLGQAGLGAFSNMGVAGLNALTNAGIAQGNNMTQAQIAGAQIEAQQSAQQSQGFGQLLGQLAGGLGGGGKGFF